MSNIEITNVDLGSVELKDNEYAKGELTFAGAGTVVAGTILARDSVSLKYVPYVKGGVTNENGIPKAVLQNDVTAEGAGDLSIKPIVSGEVRLERLIIDVDGDGSNIDAAVVDELRDYSIVALSVRDISKLDNQ